jgi:hypothetical protein
MDNIPIKVVQHALSHHFPHAHRELELLRLDEEEPHPLVQKEITRNAVDRRLVTQYRMEEQVDLLLAAYMEAMEHRGVYKAGQLMLCNLHVLICCHKRLKDYLNELKGVEFGRISPWLESVHAELVLHEQRMAQDIARADVFQSIGRTNEHASLAAEKFNAVIRDFDNLYPNKPRASRCVERLDELTDALKFFRQTYLLMQSQDALYRNPDDPAAAAQKLEAEKYIVSSGRSLPLYGINRSFSEEQKDYDFLLDSDYNSRNIDTASDMIALFQKARRDIVESQQDNPLVIEGALGSSINTTLQEVEWTLEPPYTESRDIAKSALNLLCLWREYRKAMQLGTFFDKNTYTRAATSYAICISHAIFVSNVAWALRVNSAHATYSSTRRPRQLADLLDR